MRSRELDFPIEIALPSKAAWALSNGPNWLVLRHAPSSSELSFRTWRAERLVRQSECEAEARLSRPAIPKVLDEDVVERRRLSTPPDFDGEIVVGAETVAVGISGYAIAIGASVGRCYAAVFTTRVAGEGAEEVLAARLGVVVDRIFGSVRLRSVEDRALRRHLRFTPPPKPAP